MALTLATGACEMQKRDAEPTKDAESLTQPSSGDGGTKQPHLNEQAPNPPDAAQQLDAGQSPDAAGIFDAQVETSANTTDDAGAEDPRPPIAQATPPETATAPMSTPVLSSPTPGASSEFAWPKDCEQTYSFRSYSGVPGTPFSVPAGQEVQRNLLFEAPFDRDVQAVGFRIITDNKRILHHWNLWGLGHDLLIGWLPGFDVDNVLPLGNDIGLYLPKNQALTLDVHYYNFSTVQDELDQSGVELCVITSADKFRKHTAQVVFIQSDATVPARSSVDVVHECTVSGEASEYSVISIMPHMHLLGRRSTLALTRDGSRATLHDAPFDFDYQHSVPQSPPIILKNGDSLELTCSYVNDTDRDVFKGSSTTDEMCVYYFTLYPLDAFSCNELEEP